MAKSKKAVVIKKEPKVQKAPKIKAVAKVPQKAKVSKVEKVVTKVKKVQPKIVQPEVKKVQPKPKAEKSKPKVEVEQSFKVHNFQPLPLIPINLTNEIIQNIPVEVKVKDEQQLNVSEMTIKEIMLQKGLSYEGAISFLKNNQRK